MKLTKVGAVSFAIAAAFSAPAIATATTQSSQNTFPLCIEMTKDGDKAHYAEGLHQIVDGPLLSGSDAVYVLDDGNFLQCFCPEEGVQGVQTNWLDASGLEDEEIAALQEQGWHLIENGPDWGLPSQHYLAKNSDFDCSKRGGTASPSPSDSPSPSPSETPGTESTSTPTPTPMPTGTATSTPSPTPTQTSDNNSGGGSSSSGGSSSDGGHGGQSADTSSTTSSPSNPTTEQKQGAVLGAKTLPYTGSFALTTATLLQIVGASIAAMGGVVYAKKR